MRARRSAVVAVGALSLGLAASVLAGCSREPSPEAVREELERRVVASAPDLDPAVVDCALDRFFAQLEPDGYEAFADRERLSVTDAERLTDATRRCVEELAPRQ